MKPNEALKAWANACNHTGIAWSLYKETLLCANGYHDFPETLLCAQIAVKGRDLPDLVEYVFPALPSEWEMKRGLFVSNKRSLAFYVGNAPVLEIYVLYALEDETQIDQVEAIRAKAVKKAKSKKRNQKYMGLIGKKLFGRLYTKTIGRIMNRSVKKAVQRAFRELVKLVSKSNDSLPYYCDCFTNKKPVMFDTSIFKKVTMLTFNINVGVDMVEQVQYPVFAQYRTYLETAYGDYENGLSDEIGCGLTVEEKEELKKHQSRCCEALSFLQDLRKEFGLRYYLIAGSVLGAVRHGGFIPWDDDVDIGIRVEEIENFEKIVKEQLPLRLPAGFTLEQPGANNPYPRMFSKICYEGRCCIDLWPLIPTYRDGIKAKLLWVFGKVITKIHYQKIGYAVTKFKRIAQFAGFLLGDKCVMALARRNERKYVGKKTPAYINLYSIYSRKKETMKAKWLNEEATATFNGMEVPVVGNTKLYLTHLYGNYMGFPLPWNRVSRHVARFQNASDDN